MASRFKDFIFGNPEIKVTAGDVIKEIPGEIKKRLTKKIPLSDAPELALSFGPGGARKAVINTADSVAQTPAVRKLITAIKSAVKPRAFLQEAFTAERATRASKASQIFTETPGQEGFFKALRELKGELAPKPKFEPLTIVKEQAPNTSLLDDVIKQTDVDDLFTQVQSSNKIDFFEKISAGNALQKLFNGELPAPSQLSKLEDVFGSDLIKTILDKRGGFEKFRQGVTDLLNIPRSLITSVDMSAPLRQGILLTVTKPKQSIPAFKEMFKDFFSEKNFTSWLDDLPNNPKYRLMRDSQLYIADPRRISGGLGAREESFMSNIAEKIPGIGTLVKGSSRAYIGYLNKLRTDVFTNLATKFEKEGITDKNAYKSLANFVNNATGRGSMGNFEKVAAELNTVFFSPRLIASRFNLLNPVWYAKQNPAVRKEAIKSFAEFVGVGSTILAVAKAGGADVELDPRSTDFGKIKVGDTRWDIWGGFQQWVRTFSQLASGEKKNKSGDIIKLDKKKYPFTSRADVAENFLKGKLAPIPSLISELLEGQKTFGEEMKLSREVYENTVPLYLQDMGKVIEEFGPEALFTVGVPAFFGVGTQTYKDTSKKSRFSGF